MASLLLPLVVGFGIIPVAWRKWRSGSAQSCQDWGRGFESRLPLHTPVLRPLLRLGTALFVSVRGAMQQRMQQPAHCTLRRDDTASLDGSRLRLPGAGCDAKAHWQCARKCGSGRANPSGSEHRARVDFIRATKLRSRSRPQGATGWVDSPYLLRPLSLASRSTPPLHTLRRTVWLVASPLPTGPRPRTGVCWTRSQAQSGSARRSAVALWTRPRNSTAST
jgi:hypothetical protein